MIPRLLHFILLFFYLNIIAYEPGPASQNSFIAVSEGDSLIEFFISDLLETSGIADVKKVEIADENYRPVNTIICISPVFIFLLLFFLYRKAGKVVLSFQPFYRAKSFCLEAYYSYLFRLKPF